MLQVLVTGMTRYTRILSLLLGSNPRCSTHTHFRTVHSTVNFPLRWAQYRGALPRGPTGDTEQDAAAACSACTEVEALGATKWPERLPVMEGAAITCKASGGGLYFIPDTPYSNVSLPGYTSPAFVWPPKGGRRGSVVLAALNWHVYAGPAEQALLSAVLQLARPGGYSSWCIIPLQAAAMLKKHLWIDPVRGLLHHSVLSCM